MKKIMILAAVVATLSMTGCTTTERYVGAGAGIGALGGGAIGAGLTGDAEGALVGAALGAAAGGLTGAAVAPREGPYPAPRGYDPDVSYYPSTPVGNAGQCSYRDAYGQRYLAACPTGYDGAPNPRYGGVRGGYGGTDRYDRYERYDRY